MRSPASSTRATRPKPDCVNALGRYITLSSHSRFRALLLIVSFTLVLPSLAVSQGPRLRASYSKLPLAFTANRGQVNADVKFVARGAGYSVFLTANEAVLSLNKSADANARARNAFNPSSVFDSAFTNSHSRQTGAVIRIGLAESDPPAAIAGANPLAGKTNYFLGKDPKRWRTGIPNYSRVEYHGVYPGIDVVYYGNQRRLEYDFVISPGADYKRIRMEFSGARAIRVDNDGSLILHTENGDLRQHRPVVYQEARGRKEILDGRYVVRGNNQVSFELAAYDPKRTLIIDPVLDYGTYLGGSDSDFATGIAVDNAGNMYVAGGTRSPDFPVKNAIQPAYAGETDAFITKLSADGSTLIYSTYLGGSSFCCVSAGDDSASAIAVDGLGQAYVAGRTSSADFPTVNALQNTLRDTDAFVAKLNADGSALLYSTYLGGNGFESAEGLAIDSAGNAYVTGPTSSNDFPTVNPFQAASHGGIFDGFVSKINANGSALVFSTYLGGSNSDLPGKVAVNGQGEAYVAGATRSTDFPTEHALQATNQGGVSGSDAFVTKFNAAGSGLIYSTYLGGSDDELAHSIAVDGFGNAYVVGFTLSHDFPTIQAFQDANAGAFDAFISKIDSSGSSLVYSTYFGGSDNDEAYAITVDHAGNAFFTGDTFSSDFPQKNAPQPASAGGDDAFVARLNPSGKMVFSTYLGGAGFDRAVAIAIDVLHSVYVAGFTLSTDFPTRNAFQPAKSGGFDAFVVRMSEE